MNWMRSGRQIVEEHVDVAMNEDLVVAKRMKVRAVAKTTMPTVPEIYFDLCLRCWMHCCHDVGEIVIENER